MSRMSFEDMTKDLEITEVWLGSNERCPNGAIVISWCAPNCGFGQYTLIQDENGKFHADSEHMDKANNKDFLKLLLSKIPDMTIIED